MAARPNPRRDGQASAGPIVGTSMGSPSSRRYTYAVASRLIAAVTITPTIKDDQPQDVEQEEDDEEPQKVPLVTLGYLGAPCSAAMASTSWLTIIHEKNTKVRNTQIPGMTRSTNPTMHISPKRTEAMM